jgi:hypothetical protein
MPNHQNEKPSYVDSRGAAVDMNYERALEIVLDLASQEIQSEGDADIDFASDKRDDHQKAFERVTAFYEHQKADLAGFRQSQAAREWDCLADGLDPSTLLGSLKIVHGLAWSGAMDPADAYAERDEALIEMADEQQGALDMLADMIGLNGDMLTALDSLPAAGQSA